MAQSTSRTIVTDAGALELVPISNDQVSDIQRYWPMEVLAHRATPGPVGLVFQRGDQEVHGVKLQPVDMTEKQAKSLHYINRIRIAAALPDYLEKRHQGVMVPCTYYKEKSSGLVETGVAFFVGPDVKSRSMSGEPLYDMFDGRLGAGATPMILDMMGAIEKASKALIPSSFQIETN